MIVRRAEWSPVTEAYIEKAVISGGLDDIKRQTERGAQLFQVEDDAGAVVCAFVLRVDYYACRTVGVVVAAGGACDGVDLTAVLMPHIEKHMFVGVDAIAVHTERRGLVRKLEPQGYRVAEIILEKEVKNHG
ncbi:hypothetical protein [Massilia sp. Leaf139]|uniref:hypothetical protein n=1 Tax=Massilia sp. Leaf139 TaxID=1736272 RepID=UPI0006F5EA18|nr:hypothetical protein [Massilia sp. Leaf139]KQQ97421.1 hypothetical protein ASF77_05620 [Massilia sp. Leaf139]